MARKLSFINYKGGVGKTSLIVNVGASLAEVGQRVLIVDLDVQSNSSLWLLRFERWNPLVEKNEGHIYSTFEPGVARLSDCIVRDVVRNKESGKQLPGLDLLPTTFSLIDLEEDYKPANGLPAYVQFQEQIAEIEDDYDYILFDCPPNILSASSCGIFSCNEIFVPSNPDALSLIGFTLLVEKLKLFFEASASYRVAGMDPAAQVRGVIFNSIKNKVDISSSIMRVQVRINQFKGKGVVAQDARIFNTKIRDEVIVPRSVTLGLPVCLIGDYERENTVRDDYRAVMKEIMNIPPLEGIPNGGKQPSEMGSSHESPVSPL
ncbi:ParA family protein [Coraliomargarita parva]|uniref:ParA family protein n=1 Tax=Coraliomargarita parva TaxID=3014050 RepID=UPI0022B53087|nr:AAA family ATPase [Coraliomargarita parva]